MKRSSENLLTVELLARKLTRDLAMAHHQDAITNPDQLLDLGRDHDAAVLRLRLQQIMQDEPRAGVVSQGWGIVFLAGLLVAPLAPAIFGPWMNISGSVLATWWHRKPVSKPKKQTKNDQDAKDAEKTF